MAELLEGTVPVLSAFSEALVEISTYYPLIELRPAYVLHAVQGILVRVVLDEAEATRCLLETVKTHDQTFDFAAPDEVILSAIWLEAANGIESTLGEEFVDLLLGSVK